MPIIKSRYKIIIKHAIKVMNPSKVLKYFSNDAPLIAQISEEKSELIFPVEFSLLLKYSTGLLSNQLYAELLRLLTILSDTVLNRNIFNTTIIKKAIVDAKNAGRRYTSLPFISLLLVSLNDSRMYVSN
jgi:hypothetical protein